MNAAFLCLGGNIGDRLANLKEAKRQIECLGHKIEAESGIYQTKAWGIDEAPDYYNQCVILQTPASAVELMQQLLAIEETMGRIRTDNRNASRTIDLDILFFNDEVIVEAILEIPHPRLHLRNFVLQPLTEIAPGFVHPALNKTVSQLLSECDDTGEVIKL